jgi:hypothetical protein
MSAISVDTLISKEVPFTPYDVKWIPCSAKFCAVGATNQGTGKIAVYGMEGKHLELKHEVILLKFRVKKNKANLDYFLIDRNKCGCTLWYCNRTSA